MTIDLGTALPKPTSQGGGGIWLGSQEVKEMYLGDVLVYPESTGKDFVKDFGIYVPNPNQWTTGLMKLPGRNAWLPDPKKYMLQIFNVKGIAIGQPMPPAPMSLTQSEVEGSWSLEVKANPSPPNGNVKMLELEVTHELFKNTFPFMANAIFAAIVGGYFESNVSNSIGAKCTSAVNSGTIFNTSYLGFPVSFSTPFMYYVALL
jgi:hypothetical protein